MKSLIRVAYKMKRCLKLSKVLLFLVQQNSEKNPGRQPGQMPVAITFDGVSENWDDESSTEGNVKQAI